MAVTVSVRSDLDKFARQLDAMARGQLRFAASQALTKLAREVETDTRTKFMPAQFDKPVPFTQRAFRVLPASKAALRSEVRLKDQQQQAGYGKLLALEEEGGTRNPGSPRFGKGKGRALVTPNAVKRNAYGNMPFRAVQNLLGQRGVFLAKPGDVVHKGGAKLKWGGIYKRVGRGDKAHLKLMASFFGRVQYKPRFPWHAHVLGMAAVRFPVLLRDAMALAMATARRR